MSQSTFGQLATARTPETDRYRLVYTPRYLEDLKRFSQDSPFTAQYIIELTWELAKLHPNNTDYELLPEAFDFFRGKGVLYPVGSGREFGLRLPGNPLEIVLTISIVGQFLLEDVRHCQ